MQQQENEAGEITLKSDANGGVVQSDGENLLDKMNSNKYDDKEGLKTMPDSFDLRRS